jgi:hypothetical protein
MEQQSNSCGGKGIENPFVNMVLKKKLLKKHKSKKTPFHASMFGNGLSKFFQMMISKNDNL